jgi:hypothetical protein
LTLAGLGFKQGPNGGLQMWFQNVHSGSSLKGEGDKVTSCPAPKEPP